MRRPVAAVVCTAIILLVFAPAAWADKPFTVRITDPITAFLPAEDFCGSFDVQAEAEQKFKLITFSGDRGTLWTALTAGKLKAVVTNLETGESVTISIPGPGFIDADGNTVVGTGPWLVFVPGEVLYLTGRIVFEPGPFGVQPVEVSGRTIDLCNVLS